MDSELEYRLWNEQVQTEAMRQRLIEEQQRPFYLLKPAIGLDGNQYFFLYGQNLMEGVSGFGDTAELAALDFDKNWKEQQLHPGGKV